MPRSAGVLVGGDVGSRGRHQWILPKPARHALAGSRCSWLGRFPSHIGSQPARQAATPPPDHRAPKSQRDRQDFTLQLETMHLQVRWEFTPSRLAQVGHRLASLGGYCQAYSPSLAHEGVRLPSITHSCHHHYASCPPPSRHMHQRLLDSPGLNHLCHYFPYICLVPCFSINCLSLFTCVLTLFLFWYLSVPE
jgi:hypothetical protein